MTVNERDGIDEWHLSESELQHITRIDEQSRRALADEDWFNRLVKEDFRALTPLFYGHLNPYGNFST